MPRSSVAVRAYAFAATLKVRDLSEHFPGAEIKHTLDDLHAQWPDGGGAAIAFDFGSVVFFGVDPARQAQVIASLTGRIPTEPHPPLTETFLVEVDPEAPPEVHFDRAVVPELSRPVLGVIGLLVAQSVAMDYYDEDVGEILERTGAITRNLATHGRIRGNLRDMMRFIGRCIQTRNGIIETLALFDKPEAAWEKESLDVLYTRLRETLEIDDRFRALEYKLRMIQDNLVLLADLSRQRHSLYLEVGVVVLILIEVVIMVWQFLVGSGHG